MECAVAGDLADFVAGIAGIVAGEVSFVGAIPRIAGWRRAKGIADFDTVAVNKLSGIAVFAGISKLRWSVAGEKGKRVGGLGCGDMGEE